MISIGSPAIVQFVGKDGGPIVMTMETSIDKSLKISLRKIKNDFTRNCR